MQFILCATSFVTLLSQSAASQTTLPRLEPAQQLAAKGAPAFGRLAMAAIGPDFSVVAYDEANGRVYRFRPDGTLRDSIGRKGSGPGEFRVPAGLVIGPKGEIGMADLTLHRVSIWNADGKPAGEAGFTVGMPLSVAGWAGGPVVVLTDFAKALRFVQLMPGTPERPLGQIITPQVPSATSDATACELCPIVSLANGHRLMGATMDSSYRLIEFDSTGKEVRRWQRPPEKPRARSDAEMKELIQRMNRMPGRGAGTPEGRPQPVADEKFRFPPRILGLARDGAGRIWVRANHAIAPQPVFDVFTADGRFLGSVRIGESVNGFAIAGDRLLVWGETADGESALWVHRIAG